jgi:hypothetical protein
VHPTERSSSQRQPPFSTPWKWLYARVFVRGERKRYFIEPRLQAFCVVTAVMMLNLIAVLVVIAGVTSTPLALQRSELIAISALIGSFNYWRLIKNRAADELIERMRREKRAVVRKQERWMLFFYVGSIVAPLLLALLLLKPGSGAP